MHNAHLVAGHRHPAALRSNLLLRRAAPLLVVVRIEHDHVGRRVHKPPTGAATSRAERHAKYNKYNTSSSGRDGQIAGGGGRRLPVASVPRRCCGR